MRKRVFIFLWAVVCGLLVVPLVNMVLHPKLEGEKWLTKAFLYNLDFAAQWPNFVLYQLGISTHPKQVVIGRNGWLYLGDDYAQSRTAARNGQTAADLTIGKKIVETSQAWDAWLQTKGVQIFRIMVGPNKASIYPEHLPNWAMPATPSATDALFGGTANERFIDLRAPMLASKTQYPQALYYKTDTHWNALGAGLAFNAFAQSVGHSAPELRWPTFEMSSVTPRGGGDLAKFLRIEHRLGDSIPLIKIISSAPSIEVTQYDFDSRQIIQKGGNPEIGSKNSPLLVISEGALNAKKVLWLRDSFGNSLSPLMAATFSDIVQLHWSEALKPNGRFVELVEKWKPDYVFITVVERESRSELFTYPPPLPIPQ